MPILPGLAVVFVGIAGGGHGHAKVEKQVASLVRELHVQKKALPEASVKTLARHKDGTKQIVQKLHADGVVSFEVVGKDLRLVTYDGKGDLKTYLEFTLAGGGLASDDLGTVKDSIEGDFEGLHGAEQIAKAPAADAEPEIEMDETPAAKPAAKIAAKPAVATRSAPAMRQAMDDDEMPSNLGGKQKPTVVKAVAKVAPPPAAQAQADEEEHHDAKPTETADADAVSLDEVEAATSGGSGGAEDQSLHATGTTDSLHIGAAAGVGITGRMFSPGPSSVTGYSSNPVGLVTFQGHVDPTTRLKFAIAAETTVSMSTPMTAGSAPTTMSRWEATAGYKLTTGKIEVAPQVGFGRRMFAIDSNDPSRSPDGDYNYLIAGAKAAMPITDMISITGVGLFEPVVGGSDPTMMALGPATRWAIDFGAGVEAHLTHLYARVGFDWQRFQWSWDQAGSRGAGGAVDNYASGTISVGANY